jgi:FtsH-binding integral membrane protein
VDISNIEFWSKIFGGFFLLLLFGVGMFQVIENDLPRVKLLLWKIFGVYSNKSSGYVSGDGSEVFRKESFQKDVWIAFAIKTVVFFVLAAFTLFSMFRGADDVLVSLSPEIDQIDYSINYYAEKDGKPNDSKYRAYAFQYHANKLREEKYQLYSGDEKKKEIRHSLWLKKAWFIWLKIVVAIVVWFLLLFLFSHRFRTFIIHRPRKAIVLAVYSVAGGIVLAGTVGAVFSYWVTVALSTTGLWYSVLAFVENIYAQWWGKAFLVAGGLVIVPTLYRHAEAEQRQRYSVKEIDPEIYSLPETNYILRDKYQTFARAATSWGGQIPGYLSCPNCSKDVKIHEMWTCNNCNCAQLTERLISAPCEHCGEKLKSVYCENCHQRLEL